MTRDERTAKELVEEIAAYQGNVERARGLNFAYEQVKAFHEAFNHPVSSSPVMLEGNRLTKRVSWIQEEVDELAATDNLVDLVDACADIIYLTLGTLVEAGVYPQSPFDCVQYANMSKLGPDGKPIYKEDGKVAKPEGWEPPEENIAIQINRQIIDARLKEK